jgi:RNA polymerase sigma-70 factor (ECF subfamily)
LVGHWYERREMEATARPLTAAAPGQPPIGGDGPATSLSFSEVYEEHFGFVWRSAQALGAGAAAVDDVVQEVFVTVHKRLPEFEGRSTIRTWLSRIVLNVVRHYRRSLVRRSPHELSKDGVDDPDTLPTRAPDPHDTAELAEGARLLQRLLESLDEDKREVLVLAELEELTVPEIADALELNLNTAYSRLRLARAQFERVLARQRAQDGLEAWGVSPGRRRRR